MADVQIQTQIRTEIEAFKLRCVRMLRTGKSMEKRVRFPENQNNSQTLSLVFEARGWLLSRNLRARVMSSENEISICFKLNEHKEQALIFIFV